MQGTLEVICGPMFSGKSEELIRRLRRAQIAKQKTIIFKPVIDDRYHKTNVVSHSGLEIEAQTVAVPIEVLFDSRDYEVVGIDEVQFFNTDIITIINNLVTAGKRVIVSGLDQDYRQLPFGVVPDLMALADKVEKLTAICVKCGADATTTQRLLNGEPAPYEDKTVIVGANEQYEARCRSCHEKN